MVSIRPNQLSFPIRHKPIGVASLKWDMGGGRSCSASSSSEEDGDAVWRAAIGSIAAAADNFGSSTGKSGTGASGFLLPSSAGATYTTAHPTQEDDEFGKDKPQNLKHYQIKAQKLLDDFLEKTIEVVRQNDHIPQDTCTLNGGGVRLFKKAPPGIVFDHLEELRGPKKKPRILRGEDIDEKSEEFRKQLQSVVLDGADILTSARDACQKSLSKLEAREAAFRAKAKIEEERVAELKQVRGERWLPSIVREKQVNTYSQRYHT